MSKKDYVAVADILYRRRNVEAGRFGCEGLDELVSEFAALFEADNEAFDRHRFLEACHYKYDPSPVLERLEELDKMAKIAIDREYDA